MKRSLLLFALIAIVAAGTGIYIGTRHHAPSPAAASATTELFRQQMPDADGRSHALSQWQGKVVVVNFWATWCPPCVEEMPELSALQSELGANAQILGIGIDTSSNIKEFAGKYKITYPLYVAGMGGSELSRQFGNQAGGLPFTVLIDQNGNIAKTYLGRLKIDELRADIAAL